MGSKHCEGYNPYSGLEIFAYLLFMVYLLQFLGTLLSSANFNIMLNGEAVSPFQALLLGFFGFSSTNVISNNNNNNVRILLSVMFFIHANCSDLYFFQNNNNNNNNNNVSKICL